MRLSLSGILAFGVVGDLRCERRLLVEAVDQQLVERRLLDEHSEIDVIGCRLPRRRALNSNVVRR